MPSIKQKIEGTLIKRLVSELKDAGCVVTPKGKKVLKEHLKAAAYTGVVLERNRVVALLPEGSESIKGAINAQRELAVLGYD